MKRVQSVGLSVFVFLGPFRLSMHQFHLNSTKLLTNDFPNHEHQTDGRGHVELATGPLLLGVIVTAWILLGMAVMVAVGSQLNSLEVLGRLQLREPASLVLPQRSCV